MNTTAGNYTIDEETIERQQTGGTKPRKSSLWTFEEHELKALAGSHGKMKSEDIAPLRIAEWLVKRPCVCCCGCFAIAMLFLIMIAGGKGMDFLVEQNMRQTYIFNEHATQSWEAVQVARKDLTQGSDASVPVKTTVNPMQTQQMMYELKNKNEKLLTVANVLKMAEMEKYYWDPTVLPNDTKATGYYKWCQTSVDNGNFPDCDEDKTRDGVLPELLALRGDGYTLEMWQVAIDAWVAKAFNDSTYWAFFNKDFGNQSGTEEEVVGPTLMRSLYYTAYPYPDINDNTSSYSSIFDDTEDQTQFFNDWNVDLFKALNSEWMKIKDYSTNTMDAFWINEAAFTTSFEKVYYMAIFMIFFSVMLVWGLMAIHMGSFFISLFAMCQILMSFPLAIAFYYFFFQVPFWSLCNIMSLFVVLGIGADDCFIFYDSWMQAETHLEDPTDLVKRLSYTYRRAGKAMAITTFTTCITFLATMSSRIPMIQVFGLFSALLIFFDFILSLTLFPIGLVLAWKQPCLRFCGCCGGENACLECCKPKDNSDKFRFWERCFGTTCIKFLSKFRWGLIAAHIILLIVCIGGSTTLSLPESEDHIVDPDHPLMKQNFKFLDFYSNADIPEETQIWFLWGVDGVDRGHVKTWDIETDGKPVYDQDFDIMSVEGQKFVLQVCDELDAPRNFSNGGSMVVEDSVSCFMRDYKIWREVNGETFPAVFSTTDTHKQRNEFIKSLYEFVTDTTLDAALVDKTGPVYEAEYQIGFTTDSSLENPDLRYVMVSAYTDVTTQSGYTTNLDAYDDWKHYFASMNKWATRPNMYMGLWATDLMGFPWMEVQRALIDGAVSGILIALPLALFAMLLATANWIISLLAVFVIAAVVMTLIFWMAVQGYVLGTVESLSVVIMIGFSVDYTVHIGNAYLENEHLTTRNKRIRMALLDMGVSILFGAITTFVCVIPLLATPIIYFSRFGELVMVTVAAALLWALVFFPPVLLWLGPEDSQGDLPCIHTAMGKLFGLCSPCCRSGNATDEEDAYAVEDIETQMQSPTPMRP